MDETKPCMIKLFCKGDFHYYDSNDFDDVFILPSLTLDQKELSKVHAVSIYEQRQLYNLLMLQHPKIRVCFLSSMPIDDSIVEYYWKLCSTDVSFEDFKSRLCLLSPIDSKSISLVEKILLRPLLMQKMKKFIRNPERSCIVSNISSNFELELAKKMNVVFLGFDPQYSFYGTKQGSKEIFKKANLPFPDATPLCKDENLFFEETLKLIERNPKAKMLVVKLNDSFSGKGNANLTLHHFKQFMKENLIFKKKRDRLLDQLKLEIKQMRFPHGANWDTFRERIPDMGMITEVFIDCNESPSGQGYVEKGKVSVISTHDQILDGEVYIGCIFPCEQKFRKKVIEYTEKIGQVFESLEIYGNFGVDYLAAEDGELYALEINLRITGTTHPNMTMRLLIKGDYDEKTGEFTSQSGKKKYYIASDNVVDESFINFIPSDVINILENSEHHFNRKTETGSILHLVGAVSEHGKFGVTCIHNSVEESKELFKKVVELFKHESQKAFEPIFTE
eukprot:gene4611-7993_t